jgi:FemAB-related protein (PEP-CTERM system-associated)
MITSVAIQTGDCRLLEDAELPAWDRFVAEHPQASVYHLSVWRRIVAEAFGKQWYLVAALQDGEICAGLPLVHMQSRLFGNFLVSMPYVNYGGVLLDDKSFAEPLLQQAVTLARHLGARHVELRHLANHYPHLPVSTSKVSMWLPLPETAEELFASFKAKLRSQVRKGEKNGLDVRIGGAELLDDFHTVFLHNMRDLGSPAYGRAFFQGMLDAFPETARIVVVTGAQERPLAGGFLLGFRDRIEICSASSLRKYNHLQSNMWLYWNCMKYACEQGYRIFDFGRSPVGSSTLAFKAQWGAQPVPHCWHYYLEASCDIPQLNPRNPKLRLAVQLWKRLPLSVTRWLGPAIVKHLP